MRAVRYSSLKSLIKARSPVAFAFSHRLKSIAAAIVWSNSSRGWCDTELTVMSSSSASLGLGIAVTTGSSRSFGSWRTDRMAVASSNNHASACGVASPKAVGVVMPLFRCSARPFRSRRNLSPRLSLSVSTVATTPCSAWSTARRIVNDSLGSYPRNVRSSLLTRNVVHATHGLSWLIPTVLRAIGGTMN